jgi:hypothetical protein
MRGPAMEGLVESTNGFYKPGEDGCSHPLLAVLVFTTQAARITKNPIL